jgi:hypothetical protein
MTADEAYARLRDDIVKGRLMPNERLVEVDLAASLGVGRTAVRTVPPGLRYHLSHVASTLHETASARAQHGLHPPDIAKSTSSHVA